MILKHRANTHISSIKEVPDGLDFFFHNQSHCLKFISFLQAIVPIRYSSAKQLISADLKSNTQYFKYSYCVEIPPICKDDLVCLPLKLAQSIGSISPLVICQKVSNVIHFTDPFTLQTGEVASQYWHYNFRSLANKERITEFIVLDIDLLHSSHQKGGKLALAEATVARASDLGVNDITHYTITHLGNILNPGDVALGYDLENSNFNDSDMEPLKGKTLRSEVILIRKTYPRRRKLNKQRPWKLQQLDIEPMDAEKQRKGTDQRAQQNYEEFLRDLEEDTEMRSQVNLFKAEVKNAQVDTKQVDSSEEEEPDFPQVKMDELLEVVNDSKKIDADLPQ